MNTDGIFERLTLPSGLTLNNRLVMAPMPTFAANADGTASEAEIAYYQRRAEGGVAAIVTAGCAVSSDGIAHDGQWRCDDDRFLPSLASIADAIQQAGAAAVLQLAHAGDPATVNPQDAVRAFQAAAARASRAGFQAVEVHGGHGELLQQYVSSGRSEICLDIVRALRSSGPGSVWYRLDPEQKPPAQLDLETTITLAAITLATPAQPHLDVFDVSAKNYFAGSIRTPDDNRPRAAVLARRLPDLAVMGVGGVSTPQQAARVFADGCALVGLGHVLLADPDWPQRVRGGKWRPPSSPTSGPTTSDTLRGAAVPETVIAYLLQKSKASR